MLNPVVSQSELISAIVLHPLVVTPDTTVMGAIARMSGIRIACTSNEATDSLDKLQTQSRSSCISIVEDGKLIGILTQRDILRLYSEQRDLANLSIRDVMTSNVVTLRVADFTDIFVAINLLQQHQIQYLPVIDDRNYLIQQIATQMAIAIQQATAYAQVNNLNVDLELRLAQRTAELQESQQFLQTMIETFPLAVFWKDRESRYLGCNYSFAKDANLNFPKEIIGMTDDNLPWGAFEGAAYRANDRQVIDSGCAKLGTIELQTRADGTSIWLETNKIPLRNITGETIGILGTYQDITDRKRAELKLNRLSERLSLSLKSGSLGCWEWDILRDHLIWDERMYELYGRKKSSDYESYSFWLETIHPDDLAVTEALIEQSLSGETDFDTEFRVIYPDGSIHFIKAYGLLEKVKEDCSYSMIGINFDITAAKHDEMIRQQNEQLIRQQAERELVLREITQKIRKSLDLKTIFETSVQEIRQFMETDRVGVFKFDSDLNLDMGEFIAESVDSEFQSILGIKIHDPGFGKRLGWSYQRGTINAIQDIHTAGAIDRESQFLARFPVQANLVVPLLNGTILWGLLCIDHFTAPRAWQPSEINFLNQIAEQIGIGIQQATLYQKVQLELEIRWRAEEVIASPTQAAANIRSDRSSKFGIL